MKYYDVVIVGSGPAGLSAAINLYNKGIKNVCIVTNSDINSHKPCGGFIPKKSYDLLKEMDIDIEKIGYYKEYILSLFRKNDKKYSIFSRDFYCYYINDLNRDEFDNLLYKYVLSLGIKIYERQIIKNDILKDEYVKLKEIDIHFSYLIFADGGCGYSSRYNKIKEKNIGLVARIKLEKAYPTKNELHFGIVNKGYVWHTIEEDSLNVGFVDRYVKGKDYIDLLISIAKDHFNVEISKKDIKYAFIPYGVRKLVLKDNIFVIGDAAGLIDPTTAEGIYYALLSAKHVAESIKENDCNIYTKRMKKAVNSLHLAKVLNPVFFNKFFQTCFWEIKLEVLSEFKIFAFKEIILNGKYLYTELHKCFIDYILKRQ